MEKRAQKGRLHLGLKKSQRSSKGEFYRVERCQQGKAIEFLGGVGSRNKDQTRVQSG